MASSLSTVRHGGPVSRASASSLSKGQLLHLEKSKQVSLLAHRPASDDDFDDDFDDDYEGEEELMDTVLVWTHELELMRRPYQRPPLTFLFSTQTRTRSKTSRTNFGNVCLVQDQDTHHNRIPRKRLRTRNSK